MDIESKIWNYSNTGTRVHAFLNGVALCRSSIRRPGAEHTALDLCEAQAHSVCGTCDTKFNAAIELNAAVKFNKAIERVDASIKRAPRVLDPRPVGSVVTAPTEAAPEVCCEHAPMYHGARGCDECGCGRPRNQTNTDNKENDMADEVKDRTGPLSELQHKMMLSLLTGASHVEAGRANGKGPTHTSNIVSAAVAKMGCRRTGQALGYYATHLAYLEAASVLEAAKIRDPLGDVEDHVNHVLDGLASILRARAAALLPQ